MKGIRSALVIAFSCLLAGSAGAALHRFQGHLDAAQDGGGARTGNGAAHYTLDDVANTLTFDISYLGTSGTEIAAHIHGPAAPPGAAGILYFLPAGNPKSGSIALVPIGPYTVAQQKADLLAGLWYANIHTTTFGGGEIRGQLEGIPAVPSLEWGGLGLLALLVIGTTVWLARRRFARAA